MAYRDEDSYLVETEEDVSYGLWDGPQGGKRILVDQDPTTGGSDTEDNMEPPPPSPYGGRAMDLAIDPPEEETLVQRDANVRRVTISCEIISYSAVREGPGPLAKAANWLCGDGSSDQHLDEILHDVNGTFRPGELICLMGPSGAGKTTLLNILAARAGGFLVGTVKMNNRVLEQKDMRMMMNYIPQDDTLFGSLTPRETLWYTAKLRIANQTEFEREELIEGLIEKLGITPKSADAVVGDDLVVGKGQKKRTSVAMELVTNPSILFVDEATSGMDTATAEDVIRILRDISRTGRTVICTIHQPSFEIFRMFDTLLFLHSGYVVYNGPLANSTRYFNKMGWTCPDESNPADFFMKILHEQNPRGEFIESCNIKQQDYSLPGSDIMMVGNKVIHRKPQTSWAAAWKAHSLQTNNTPATTSNMFGSPGGQNQFDDLDYPTGLVEQFNILLNRSLWMTFRDRQQFRARVLICACVSIFMGLTYWNINLTQDELQNRESVIFSSILFNGMNMLMNTVILFPLERAVITREFQNGTYRMISYYVARVLTSIVFQFAYVSVYVTILYFMAGLRLTFTAYLVYVITIGMVGMIAVTLGILIGALVPSVNLGPGLVTPVLMPLVIFSGYLIARDTIPTYFIWLYYISFFQYAFHILVINQVATLELECCCLDSIYGDPSNDCFCDGANPALYPTPQPCPPVCTCGEGTIVGLGANYTGNVSSSCPAGQGCTVGQTYLDSLGYYAPDGDIPLVGQDLLILLAMWFVIVVMGYSVMLWRGRAKVG